MSVVRVRAGGGAADYDVVFEAGGRLRLAERLRDLRPGVRRWVVISDDTVAPLHGRPVAAGLADAGLGGDLLTFPAGEANKRRSEWGRLTDELLAAGVGRDGGVVAVGGGVTGDLAGFVAATFMRGIPVVQLPTSLLAMIDASVGGKTGVDTSHGKNLVGAFHPPVLVLADPETIATLPRAERAQGLAEALKHGWIRDAAHADGVERAAEALLAAEPDALERVVHRSVEIKAEVVSRDEREGGVREILNFGHTLGHALETDSEYRLPHGSAVGIGMVLEARLGEAWGVTAEGTADRIARALRAVGLPTRAEGYEPGRIAALCARDKKARGRPRIVLLERPGGVARSGDAWAHPREVREIEDTLRSLAG